MVGDERKVLDEVKTKAELALGELPAEVLVYVVEKIGLNLLNLRFGGGGERPDDGEPFEVSLLGSGRECNKDESSGDRLVDGS